LFRKSSLLEEEAPESRSVSTRVRLQGADSAGRWGSWGRPRCCISPPTPFIIWRSSTPRRSRSGRKNGRRTRVILFIL